MALFLSCHPRELSKAQGTSIHIEDLEGKVELYFYYMWWVIDSLAEHVLHQILKDISQIEQGLMVESSAGVNCWACFFDKNKAEFWDEFASDDDELRGGVSLAQFKLAVQTYLQFLEDPERKPITVPFPEQ